MDEDGFAQFAGIPNLAHRAVVTLEEATEAVRSLESPDSDSSDSDHEGRRIERVPGGWMVLNATKYREMVTRIAGRERTRLRVAKHRAQRNASVTERNDPVTKRTRRSRKRNASVMQSEAETEANTEAKKKSAGTRKLEAPIDDAYIQELQEGELYRHLNVRRCYLECVDWWKRVKSKIPTRAALRGWLKNEDPNGRNGISQSNLGASAEPFAFVAEGGTV